MVGVDVLGVWVGRDVGVVYLCLLPDTRRIYELIEVQRSKGMVNGEWCM
jgi:hypothetical protein